MQTNISRRHLLKIGIGLAFASGVLGFAERISGEEIVGEKNRIADAVVIADDYYSHKRGGLVRPRLYTTKTQFDFRVAEEALRLSTANKELPRDFLENIDAVANGEDDRKRLERLLYSPYPGLMSDIDGEWENEAAKTRLDKTLSEYGLLFKFSNPPRVETEVYQALQIISNIRELLKDKDNFRAYVSAFVDEGWKKYGKTDLVLASFHLGISTPATALTQRQLADLTGLEVKLTGFIDDNTLVAVKQFRRQERIYGSGLDERTIGLLKRKWLENGNEQITGIVPDNEYTKSYVERVGKLMSK